MPKPRCAKVAVVGLLFLLLLSSSEAMALTIPSPPEKSAPANIQSGPLQNAQSFPGGILLVKDGSTDQNVSAKEFVVEFFCLSEHYPYISKLFSTAVGESISGPISSDQASGIIDAVNSVRPPKLENLTETVGGIDTEGNITYTMTAMDYNVTTYSVWTTTQQSPAVEQRLGYIVVSVPVKPTIERIFLDLTGSSCEDYALNKFGPGWNSNSTSFIRAFQSWLQNPLGPLSALPAGGVSPIFTYAPVEVLSSAGEAGAAEITPGDNVTFALPPGSYSAVDKVTILGISFNVNCGTFSSSAGATAAQFTVTVGSVESTWHDLEISMVLVLIVVIVAIFWRFRLWPHVARGSRRVSHAVHEWIDERMRASRGEMPSGLENETSTRGPRRTKIRSGTGERRGTSCPGAMQTL